MQTIHRVLTTLHPGFPTAQINPSYTAYLEHDELTVLQIEIDPAPPPSPILAVVCLHVRNVYVDAHQVIRESIATFAVRRPPLRTTLDIQRAEGTGTIALGRDALPWHYAITGFRRDADPTFKFVWRRIGNTVIPEPAVLKVARDFAVEWDRILERQNWLMPSHREAQRLRPPTRHRFLPAEPGNLDGP